MALATLRREGSFSFMHVRASVLFLLLVAACSYSIDVSPNTDVTGNAPEVRDDAGCNADLGALPSGVELAFGSARGMCIVGEQGVETFDAGFEVSWSASRDRMAFMQFPEDPDSYPQIFSRREDSRETYQLTEDPTGKSGEPAISPDGESVAFVDSHGLTLIPWNGGDARLIVPLNNGWPLYSPAWSADGVRLAYATHTDDGLSVLSIVDLEAGNVRHLTGTERGVGVAWSPDGMSLVFSGDRDYDSHPNIYVVPASGGASTRLTAVAPPPGTDASVATDESCDIPGFLPGTQMDTDPAWSLDGQHIAFIRSESSISGDEILSQSIVCVMASDGSDLRLVAVDVDGGQRPTWLVPKR